MFARRGAPGGVLLRHAGVAVRVLMSGGVALAVLGLTAAAARAQGAPATIDLMYWPAERQVAQRNNDNWAVLNVLGHLRGSADGVQVQVTVMPGGNGVPIGWVPLARFTLINGQFSGYMALRAGGWYSLEFRAVYQGRVGASWTVNRVGAGEVFILAGQSNAGNGGELDPNYQLDDRISSFDGGRWAAAANPLPFAQGGGGCPWVYMSNLLMDVWKVPIGLCPVACGNTSVTDWQPGHTVTFPGMGPYYLFGNLTRAILTLQPRGGVRAVLWFQGENDALTPLPTYQALLTNLIVQSRNVTGVNVAWMIALDGYNPGVGGTLPGVGVPLPLGAYPLDPRWPPSLRLAQYAVTSTVPNTYLGPTSDDLGAPAYRYAPSHYAHMNITGLSINGTRWAAYLLTTPQLIPVQLDVVPPVH
jgi:hypothetical protein